MNARQRAMLPVLLDIVIPIAGYYVLSALGVSDFWALTLSGLVTAAWALTTTIRRGRLDGVGTLVVIEIALSLVLLVVTRDPRIVLLKSSFYTGVAGLYLLWTCLVGRPLTVETARPFATKGGDPVLERAADAAWEHSPAYRREHVRITAIWGVLWLVESVVRGVIVLRVDVATGVWASQIPGIVALVLGMLVSALRGPTLKRHVLAYREDEATSSAPGDDATTSDAGCRPAGSA